jgi:hypothetical protein
MPPSLARVKPAKGRLKVVQGVGIDRLEMGDPEKAEGSMDKAAPESAPPPLA